MKKGKKAQINYNISEGRVLVIGDDGSKVGEFLLDDAVKLAESRSLDLVKVSNARVPACKIMNYKRFMYEKKKTLKAAKSSPSRVKTKELRMSPRIADGDLDIRIAKIKGFIQKGHSVKVVMRFKGSDMRHIENGRQRCNGIIDSVSDMVVVDQPPVMNGRSIFFMLSPK